MVLLLHAVAEAHVLLLGGVERGRAGRAAHGERQLRHAGYRDRLAEADRHLHALAALVDGAVRRQRLEQHAADRGRLLVAAHAAGVVAERQVRAAETQHRGVAAGVENGAAVQAQAVRRDPERAAVAFLHHVAEADHLLPRPGVGRVALVAAERQGQARCAGHGHRFAEADLDLQRLAEHEGAALLGRGGRRDTGHLGRDRVLERGVDLMSGGVGDGIGAEIQPGVVSGPVPDAAAVQGERAGGDAEAVGVTVVGLYPVAEPQAAPGGAHEARAARRVAHGEGQLRRTGHGYRLAEPDLQHDRLAAHVAGAAARPRGDGQSGHRGRGNQAAVHLAARFRRHRGMGQHGVGDAVGRLDAAAVEPDGVGRQPDPVRVPVHRLHPVAEDQGPAVVGAGEGRGSGVGPDGQLHPRAAGYPYRAVEHGSHLDRLAALVGVAARR